MKHRAFTLWELLAVVAVVAIGATISYPNVNPARENSRRSSCQSNLKQIGLAFLQYAQDADAKAPPVDNWTRLLAPYLPSEAIFQCPSSSGDQTGTTDYFYNARLAGAKNKLIQRNKPLFTILVGEGADDADASYNLSQLPAAWRTDQSSPAWRHLDGANYGFVDGHVKWFKAEKFLGARDAATPTFEVK